MTGELDIDIAGQHFVLNTFRSLYWPQQQALLIADLHVGKAAHFRQHGLAMPAHYLKEDLNRLSAALLHYEAQQLYILGDLLHAGRNSEWPVFEEWQRQHPQLNVHLILGNHDNRSASWLQSMPLIIHQHVRLNNCLLNHEPLNSDDELVISGHIHPGVALTSMQKEKIRLPAFLISPKQIILPAFSAFTGLDTNYAAGKPFDAFVIAQNKIIAFKQTDRM
jgi:DNA ligase-associated metallophosphoesterase